MRQSLWVDWSLRRPVTTVTYLPSGPSSTRDRYYVADLRFLSGAEQDTLGRQFFRDRARSIPGRRSRRARRRAARVRDRARRTVRVRGLLGFEQPCAAHDQARPVLDLGTEGPLRSPAQPRPQRCRRRPSKSCESPTISPFHAATPRARQTGFQRCSPAAIEVTRSPSAAATRCSARASNAAARWSSASTCAREAPTRANPSC